jgi:hypothetical protein
MKKVKDRLHRIIEEAQHAEVSKCRKAGFYFLETSHRNVEPLANALLVAMLAIRSCPPRLRRAAESSISGILGVRK